MISLNLDDEATIHAKEVADTVSCKDCADEHRQLALWLEELKYYKEREKEKMNEVVLCRDLKIR
jgi:hypothetical protein